MSEFEDEFGKPWLTVSDLVDQLADAKKTLERETIHHDFGEPTVR